MKYPNITVRLVGRDGNAFTILGAVTRAMRRHKVGDEEIEAFRKEATAGDYDHLLRIVQEWVNVE